MTLDQLIQLGWDDAADNFCERDKKNSTSKWRIPAVIQPQMDDDKVAPAPTTFGVLMLCLDIVRRILQMLQGTS